MPPPRRWPAGLPVLLLVLLLADDDAGRGGQQHRWRRRAGVRAAAAAACAPPPGAQAAFIDPATPASACTKRTSPSSPAWQLVFSDEFEVPKRGEDMLGQGGDAHWTAVDLYYSSDYQEWQNYKPRQVAVEGGALRVTLSDVESEATLHAADGDKLVRANKTSGMLQSWNKFCFTGGYAEFAVRLPGNARDSGLWAAAWLEGNLGRAGYLRSTAGTWPYSYGACAGSGRLPWSTQPGQRLPGCGGDVGRGAPEIDVLEYGIFDGAPTFVHTMQMAPVAPPGTSWMLPSGPDGSIPGIKLPGADGPAKTYLGRTYGELSRPGFPRTGSALTDTYTASSLLGAQHFAAFHTYAVEWEPGEYVRWLLDGEPLFEVTQEALRAQTNAAGDSVGARDIPKEAMYIIINLAMANATWARVSPSLQLPATMLVDYVRVWQRPGAINVGCSPPARPTQPWVACHKGDYLGADEDGLWRLGACGALSSADNTLLLASGATAAAVVAGAVAAALAMRSRLAAAAAAGGRLSLAELRAAKLPAAARAARCYVGGAAAGGAGAFTREALMRTRPDLVAAADADVCGGGGGGGVGGGGGAG